MDAEVVRNDDGTPVVLSEYAMKVAEINQRKVNDLGLEINITTLTSISKKISDQKFFEVRPSLYLPVKVGGEAAWSSNITHYRSFEMGDQFETGIINQGGNNGRLAQAQAGVDSINVKVRNWAKAIGWTLFELQQASKSGNWDLVSTLEKARKKNWDLGIQRIAFLGARGDSSALGLLNQPSVNVNTTFITSPISGLSPAALKVFVQGILEKFRDNCARTAWPTHFIVPESDYNGMASQASADFPVKSVKTLLEEAFRDITQNPAFKILPLAYADAQYHLGVSGIVGKQCYVLLNYDEESLSMEVPVDYTNTLANSMDNFSFQNAAYGQFTGVGIYRPLEILYFQY